MTPANETKRREILQHVRQTCTDLAAKFEQLHHQVIKPVEKAKDAVSSTMDTVTDTVSCVKHVVDSMGEHVARRPWLAIAGSMAAGVGAGLITGGSSRSSADVESASNGFTGYAASTSATQEPGFLSKQFNKLTGVAVGAGLAVVRDIVKDKMPEWADAADSIAIDLTEKLGAVPFTGPILQPSDSVSTVL